MKVLAARQEQHHRFHLRVRHGLRKPHNWVQLGKFVVVGLSGYVHAQSGKIYAFSFVFNRYHVGVYAVHAVQDEMLKELITRG